MSETIRRITQRLFVLGKEEEKKSKSYFQEQNYIPKGIYDKNKICYLYHKLGDAKKELEVMNLTLSEIREKISKSNHLRELFKTKLPEL